MACEIAYAYGFGPVVDCGQPVLWLYVCLVRCVPNPETLVSAAQAVMVMEYRQHYWLAVGTKLWMLLR